MKVTSVKIRQIKSNRLIAIASIALDDEMIINDIKVIFDYGDYKLDFPNSEYAAANNQKNIVLTQQIYNHIKYSIIRELKKPLSHL